MPFWMISPCAPAADQGDERENACDDESTHHLTIQFRYAPWLGSDCALVNRQRALGLGNGRGGSRNRAHPRATSSPATGSSGASGAAAWACSTWPLEPGLERHVALKLIAPEAAADEVFARRFAEESRIAASIEHPNVVPIYAAGEEDGVPFIAMRYVSGADLAKRLAREGRLEPAAAVALIAQVGNGLDAIHAAGLVHRDVKPANVLLSGDDGADARLHHRLRRRPQRRHRVRPDPDRPLRRHARLRRPRADLRRRGRRPRRRLRARLPALQAADRRGALPQGRRGGAPLRPPQRPAAGALAVRAGGLDGARRRRHPGDVEGPEDRYPSAGDLGRAAQAALSGEQPTLPERTVATGAAATRTAETSPAGETAGPRQADRGDRPTRRRSAQAGRATAPQARRRRRPGGGGDRCDRGRGGRAAAVEGKGIRAHGERRRGRARPRQTSAGRRKPSRRRSR